MDADGPAAAIIDGPAAAVIGALTGTIAVEPIAADIPGCHSAWSASNVWLAAESCASDASRPVGISDYLINYLTTKLLLRRL